MSTAKRKVELEILVVQCDLCQRTNYEQTIRDIAYQASSILEPVTRESAIEFMGRCCLCGHDFCNHHGHVETCEDGSLCPDCSKTHEFDLSEGVGVVERGSGRRVKAPYL